MGDGSRVGAREPRLVGEGREAEIFEWDGGRVLRLLRDPGAASHAEVEAAAMAAAHEAGAPAPAVYDVVEMRGRPGVVVDRVDGPDLLAVVARRPWTVGTAGRILGEVHARLHGTEAPPGLPDMLSPARRLESRLAKTMVPPSALMTGVSHAGAAR